MDKVQVELRDRRQHKHGFGTRLTTTGLDLGQRCLDLIIKGPRLGCNLINMGREQMLTTPKLVYDLILKKMSNVTSLFTSSRERLLEYPSTQNAQIQYHLLTRRTLLQIPPLVTDSIRGSTLQWPSTMNFICSSIM